MTQVKATARPWSLAVETEAEEGLTITIPEIGRCLHDWEWADAEEWERDLANADLIVTAVNERDALLNEVAQLREALIEAVIPYEGILADRASRRWIAPEVWSAIETAVAVARAALQPKAERS